MDETHYVECSSSIGCLVSRQVGITHFHVLSNALAVARGINKQRGRKSMRVVMDQGHFHVKVDA